MPKTYSDKEKKQIIASLKKEANVLMREKGVKKTTVDELVKRVGIPKGTFYLFYPSKEMLLFEVSQDFHEQIDEYITKGFCELISSRKKPVEELDFSDCVEEITDILLGAIEITYQSCLSVLLVPESMNLILSKIPNEILEKHRKEDHHMGGEIFRGLSVKNGMSLDSVVGAFMMLIFGGMYKREIGEANWKESMRIVIKGIVLQLVG